MPMEKKNKKKNKKKDMEEDTWFQEDGSTCHTASETTELLRENFPGRVMSCNWPPRSCDSTPCDCFLRGLVKSRVYANKPQTDPELKAEIRRATGETEPQLCGNVADSFIKRATVCQQIRGGHLSDVVFHK